LKHLRPIAFALSAKLSGHQEADIAMCAIDALIALIIIVHGSITVLEKGTTDT
jgi:hypothetical protein